MLQLEQNPPMAYCALAGALGPADWEQPWLAVYAKPRQEKALAWDLLRRGATYFLPMVLRQTSSGGRRRRNMYPLFPSYIFLADNEEARLAAVKSDRVVRLVPVDAAQQPTFRRELAALEAALRSAPESVELYPRLAIGTRVLVIAGPLKGVEGVVMQVGQKRKLWLGVTTLGVGATVEIHPDLVESL